MTRFFQARKFRIPLGSKPIVMGIVNTTPDSFSDGGQAYGLDRAVAQGLRLAADGADVLDLGGESTRPGSEPVPLDEELQRVIPVIRELRTQLKIPISIDTYKSEVARQALAAGADIVNDISGGTFSPDLPTIAAQYQAGVIVMHIKGTPRDMQKDPHYEDLMVEVSSFLQQAVERYEVAGVNRDSILVDPGIGFGKQLSHNLELIRRCSEFRSLAAGVLLGPSRKSFLGLLTGSPVADRLPETIAAVLAGIRFGADVVRVHDVAEVVRALRVSGALTR